MEPPFTVVLRVQLHNADSDEYKPLSDALAEKGFAKTITMSNGVTYDLPWGTYIIENVQRSDAAKRAKAAIESVEMDASYLMVQANDSDIGAWKLREHRPAFDVLDEILKGFR